MQPSCGRPAITWIINRHNRLMVGVPPKAISHVMSASIRKIQDMLSAYFKANGWEWASTWRSESHPAVLTEFWTVQSRWSPSDLKIYIGFENWDIYDSVGLATEIPIAGEKNEWLEQVTLLKKWQDEFDGLLQSIARLREEHTITSDESQQ